jgi:hypothetical protein
MAITRRQHREKTRYLRSGARLRTPSPILTPAHQAYAAPRTRARRFPVNPSHIDEETLPKQPQEPNPKPNTPNAQAPLHIASYIGEEPADSLQNRFNTSQGTSPSAETPETLEEVGPPTTTGPTSPSSFHSATVDPIQCFVTGTVPADPDDPKEVGVPKDGEWDIIDVLGHRHCIQHKEMEWLLRYDNSWMYASDFKVRRAKGKLEAKLEEYNSSPWEVDVSDLAFQAECTQSLWDQLDTPIQRSRIGDKTIYQSRWKLYWTPQSNIDNLDWVRSSYKGAK